MRLIVTGRYLLLFQQLALACRKIEFIGGLRRYHRRIGVADRRRIILGVIGQAHRIDRFGGRYPSIGPTGLAIDHLQVLNAVLNLADDSEVFEKADAFDLDLGIGRNEILPVLLRRIVGRSLDHPEILSVLVRADVEFAHVKIHIVLVALASGCDQFPIAVRVIR